MAAEPNSPEDPSDAASGVPSPEPGDADVTRDQQGWFGTLQQNLTSQRQVMEQ